MKAECLPGPPVTTMWMSSGLPTIGQSASSSLWSTQSGQFSALYIARSLSKPTLLRARSKRNFCTSALDMPPEAIVCACSGPNATSTSPRITEPALLWPTVVIVSATTVKVVSADEQTWSLMLCGPSPENTVTVLSLVPNPRVTRNGSQGVAASFSATQ